MLSISANLYDQLAESKQWIRRLSGDRQWKIDRLENGDPGAPGVFLVPVPLSQRLVFSFLPVALIATLNGGTR